MAVLNKRTQQMSIVKTAELHQATEPTQEELDLEAKAWGYDNWEEFCKARDDASQDDQFEETP